MAWRRTIKAAVAIIAFGYCMLVLLGGLSSIQNDQLGIVQVTELNINSAAENKSPDIGKNKTITLDDIFISVKTSKQFHKTRLPVILQTWFQLAKEQIWFFTDEYSPKEQELTNGHMINTKCMGSHYLLDLCCKTAVEYDHFLDSGKKWWCHFDDDNYVNVPRLVSVLQKYNPQKDWYLGRTSVPAPVEIFEKKFKGKVIHSFRFGTFGAGVCISRSLGLKMSSLVSGGRFISLCQHLRFPDDISVAFVIEARLKVNLTVIPEFHSHLEQLQRLPSETFHEQISFGYGYSTKEDKGWNAVEVNTVNDQVWNVVKVPGFDERYDPTRFLSLHCFLFPHFKFCPR